MKSYDKINRKFSPVYFCITCRKGGCYKNMKISFSTLGCPNYDWKDICSMTKDLGFNGIEVREISSEHSRSPFTDDKIAETAETLKKMRIEIPCLSTGCCLKYTDKHDENIKEITGYINAAQAVGASYIRILADEKPGPDGEVDDNLIANELRGLLKTAEEKGVVLLVETNGVYCDTARLKNLLDTLQSDYVGALWDVHHPYRYMGERPEETLQNLGAYIKHVHVKDSVIEDGKVTYK